MAFRLTKAQCDSLKSHCDGLAFRRKCVEDSFADLPRLLSTAVEKVNNAIDQYNTAAQHAREFVDDIATTCRDEFDERSERWQESDNGQAAAAFVEDWENMDIQLVDSVLLVQPDAPEFGECRLDDLPDEAD